MKFLLDTNVIAAMFRDNPQVIERMKAHRTEDFGVSAIAAHELFFGAYNSGRPAFNLSRISLLQFAVIDFDWNDGKAAGEVRALLKAAGTPIGPYDTLIAGQALARDLTLITHNTREFRRVRGLRLDDWEL